MIRSMIICEVSEEAKENGLPETVADSSTSPAMSSSITEALELLEQRLRWLLLLLLVLLEQGGSC